MQSGQASRRRPVTVPGTLAAHQPRSSHMKAAVYYQTGDPSVLRYEEVPDPDLRPAGLLIDVKAIGIQGGDTLNRRGGMMASTPHIVGYQAAGVVRAAGERASSFRPGDRVVAPMPFGSHAAVVSVPETAAYLLPTELSFEAAAAVPIEFGTADDCLFEFGHLRPGETVLIQAGASGVGLAAIQLAKRAGATVFATASNEDKLRRLAELGVDHGINYTATDFVQETRRLTDGRGVDLVVDSVGGHVLAGSLQSLAYRGRCVTVGNAGREQGEKFDISSLGAGNQSLTGVFLGAEIATDRVQKMIGQHLADIAKGD